MKDIRQEERRQNLLKLYLNDVKDKITSDGKIMDFFEEGPLERRAREQLWVAYSLLFDDNAESIEKANVIIKDAIEHDDGKDLTVCHFAPTICIQIMLRHKEKLRKDVYDILFAYVDESLGEVIDNPEHEFVGVNDNFPCMATFSAIIGGKLVGNDVAVSWGKRNLESLCKMLKRRGLPSEHTSPTYTPVQIMPIADIVTFTDDEEVRELALYAERRLSYGALAFYHSGMGKMCGPYSRAYTVDSVACVHMIDFWLYSVLGIKTISVLDEMFVDGKINRVMHGSRWFETVQFIWISMSEYHLTDKMIEDDLKRKYPYEVKADCEFSSSRDDVEDGKTDTIYPAGENEISCYMTDEYAVGVSKVPFHNGIQSDCFHLLCKKTDKIEHSKDLQSVYLRYIVNDERPSALYSLYDRGRKLAYSNGNMGFVGYRPTRRIVGEKVKSLKLSIIIPQIYEYDIEKIISEDAIFLKINNTFVAFYALNNKGDIKIEHADGFIMISLYNYLGEAKVLTFDDYFDIVNGVLYAVGDASECTFEEFVARKKVIKEKCYRTTHSRQSLLRNIYFEYENKSIELEYDVENCGVKYSLSNGKRTDNVFYYDSIHKECNEKDLGGIINE